MKAWILAVVFGLAACSGSPGSSSSGSSSSSSSTGSSGTSSSSSGSSSGSSGTSGDAIVSCGTNGAPDCSSGAMRVESAGVAANPYDVLTAKVTVATQGASSVRVLFQVGSESVQTTPAFTATTGNQVIPVLGLLPSTTYALQVLAADNGGQLARSPVLSFTTAALPDSLSNYAFQIQQPGTVLPGHILLGKNLGLNVVPQDAVIIDRSGRVVWYLEESGASPRGDFAKQPDDSYTVSLAGTSDLPDSFPAVFQQVNSLGEPVRTWSLPGDGGTNLHDMRIQPNGDALMLGEGTLTVDMSAYDGGLTNAVLVGNTLNRVQPDGGVVFTYDFFDDFDPTDVDLGISHAGAFVDAIHANSIDVTGDGNYLVSARDMSQVRKIDAHTGEVIWKLGGARSDFTFPDDPLGGFSMQHFARELGPDDILLFDDGDEHSPSMSRAVEYQLHFDANGHPTTANMIWQYVPPLLPNGDHVFGSAKGSAQRLPDGHTLICYGTFPRVDEVDAEGNLVWQLSDPQSGSSFYRAVFVDSLY